MKKQEALVGIKEIARRGNVSIGTVDRVLNNRAGVSPDTKARILDIIKELDYQPNVMARRLASRKVLRIATLIPASSSESGYWDAPLLGINQAAEELKSFAVTVDHYFFDQNDRSTFNKKAREILKGAYSGLLLAPMFESESLAFAEKCTQKQIPYVLINSDLTGGDPVCYIGPDLYKSGYLAAHIANYILTAEKRVLVVNISKEMDQHHHLLMKEKGFRAYFGDNGLNVSIIKTDLRQTDYESIKLGLQKIFHRQPVDLVFVTNSRVFNVARFLAETGNHAVKLIGYDFLPENIEYLKSKTIDFLICQKPQEQGYKGIMSLYRHLLQNPVK
ncbi:MAG: LacI family DNA-binding transcriptional regulator, partial [Bacteroidetes bacterium]|nr:LacI family DNA-binding transcriptional regulator [Bacteroidota bacterium]